MHECIECGETCHCVPGDIVERNCGHCQEFLDEDEEDDDDD